MRKEQKPAAEHQHFKAACKTSCVSKFQTDCSHMQTCPKELHKTCLSIHPKHIKFLLQEQMLGSLRAPQAQPTQAAEPPRTPWVTQVLLQKHKGWLMGFCIHSFSKLRLRNGCIWQDAYFICFAVNKILVFSEDMLEIQLYYWEYTLKEIDTHFCLWTNSKTTWQQPPKFQWHSKRLSGTKSSREGSCMVERYLPACMLLSFFSLFWAETRLETNSSRIKHSPGIRTRILTASGTVSEFVCIKVVI